MNSRASNWEKIAAGTCAAIVIAYYTFVTFQFVPNFIGLLAELDADLPSITTFVFDTYMFWNVFALAALVGVVMIFRRKRRLGWYVMGSAFVSILVASPILVEAMYAPIFAMG